MGVHPEIRPEILPHSSCTYLGTGLCPESLLILSVAVLEKYPVGVGPVEFLLAEALTGKTESNEGYSDLLISHTTLQSGRYGHEKAMGTKLFFAFLNFFYLKKD